MIPPADLAAIRFGTGLPAADGPSDATSLLQGLGGADPMLAAFPGPSLAEAMEFVQRGNRIGMASRKTRGEKPPELKAVRKERNMARTRTARLAIARALDAPSGFRERLVHFWTDHFTVVSKGSYTTLLPAAFADEAIRPHVAGRFADMVTASTMHPAMLVYLDQAQSVGPDSKVGRKKDRGLNENLARELIELHTLGVEAKYSQADVTQMAKLMTGLGVSPEGFVFRPQQAEPGAETVLGVTYDGEGVAPVLAALDDLATRPETAGHIARKLAVHFVSDTPDEGMVQAMTRAFAESRGELLPVYAAMLDHPAAWTPVLAKARQPLDFLTAALRALGIDGRRVMEMPEVPFRRTVFDAMAAMGQPWQAPRGPDGWPEATEAWITPQLLAQRVTWAMEVPSRLVADLPEPADLLARALGSAADETVAWAATRAETRAEGVGVVLASPMFNRR